MSERAGNAAGGSSPTASRRSTRSHGSDDGPRSASASFFIVHEPTISPVGDVASLSDEHGEHLRRTPTSSRAKSKSKKKGRGSPFSPASRDDAPRLRTVQLASTSGGDASETLHIHEEGECEDDDKAERQSQPQNEVHSWEKTPVSLTILNRVGSAPDLPLHSSVSSVVYSSSKKRSMLKTVGTSGAGPRSIALQRSRLVPLPIDIRTGTLKKDPSNSNNNKQGLHESRSVVVVNTNSAQDQQAEEERSNTDYAIAALKQRMIKMEKEAARDLKQRQVLEKQTVQLLRENQRLSVERQELQSKLEQVEKDALVQKHSFEKLSDRYGAVYGSLQKLTEQHLSASPDNHTGPMQSVLQALTRENQEFQRKIRVLEARHIEDKTLAGKQEKKIKRLRAEMEALHHMNDASNRDDGAYEAHSEFSPTGVNSKVTLNGAVSSNPKNSPHKVSTAPAISTPLSSSSTTTNGSTSHLISGEDYQYIDPNILKVLEKVDSQFSITNAINLSVVLKKWFNSCLRVVSSTNISSVLKLLLTRICELLHCDHAAIFEVNHTEQKLIGKYAESGDVHWELPLDKGIIGFSARQNALCNVQRAYDDPRFYSSTDTITGIPTREVLCIPIVHELQPGQSHSVLAVLQAWNTTHQKPFTPNDQILGGLLTIQAGTIFLQTKVAKTLQKINTRLVRIIHMQDEIVPANLTTATGSPHSEHVPFDTLPLSTATSVPLLQLVSNAQKQFSECIGVKKLRIFVLDAEVMRVWHVGSELDATSGQVELVRKYSNVFSSLCSSALKQTSSSCMILEDPTSEAAFNDIVDLKGGAGGMYLAPIASPWGDTPLGMIQVARSAVHSFTSGDDPGFTAAVVREKESAQAAEDSLKMELIEVFARVFSGLLHHAKAQQLYDTCPQEVRDARLAYITDRLESLDNEYRQEEEQNEAKAEQIARTLAASAMMEQRILESAQRERARVTRDSEVIRERDNQRRVSCTEATLQPHGRLHVRDSRLISSAGSTRKAIGALLTAASDGISSVDADEADSGSLKDAEMDDESDDASGMDEEADKCVDVTDFNGDTGEAKDAVWSANADAIGNEGEEALTRVEDDVASVENHSWHELQHEDRVDKLPFDAMDWERSQEEGIERVDHDYVDDGALYQQQLEGEQEGFGKFDAPDWPVDEGGGSWRDPHDFDAPVGLVSTDSAYEIDLSYSSRSSAELNDEQQSDSF